jgi:Family of unknown function (DUF6166)
MNRQRIYTGHRQASGLTLVHVIGRDGEWRRLNLHPSKCNHSPTGFEWGYQGSGPAQLAFEILFDVFEDADLAWRLHQQFKRECIAVLPRQLGWQIGEGDVVLWAAKFAGSEWP